MGKFRMTGVDRHIPVSLAIFGGSHGQHLNQVRGLFVSLKGDRIVKLEILFCTGHPAMFLGPNLEPRNRVFFFPVDGPGGERITTIREIFTGDDRRFRGFMVTAPCCYT
jgi:hypothetical protein